jgi:phenylacetate-CoA ligase
MFDSEHEAMPTEQLDALKLERLNATVAHAYRNVAFYRARLDEAGVGPDSIQSLDDLAKIPFTTKDDLRAGYPFGMFAVPMRDIVRVHASSGTTGQVTVVGYTKSDIEAWSGLMARTLACAGGTANDVVQVAYGYGLFTGGLGLHYGVERLGATAIPVSGGNTKRQISLMVDFGSTILACTPSYALYMAEVAQEMGVDPADIKLKAGVFGAEPWSEAMRDEIEKAWGGIKAIDIYGLSEVIGPGVASECLEQNGLHVFEDNFIVECIDPQTLAAVPPGTQGELVFTTINKEGIPVLRYRTRDISTLIVDPCPCGRTHTRMARVTGRTDDMLIIRGVNVFPSQIEQVLGQIEGTEPHYQLVIDRKDNLDVVGLEVEVNEKVFSDEVRGLEKLRDTVARELLSQLGVSIDVKLVEPKSIQRSEGKAKRVVDRRQL